MPGEPPTAAHSRNAGSSFLKKQTYDTCTQLCGAVDQSCPQSLRLSNWTVFPAPLYHEGNSTQMTMIMKRRLLLFFCCLFGKYIHMIRAVGKIPSQLSSIKVNFVSCLFKVIIHLAAAGFFGGCLFSALRYSLVAWFFSVIALFQGITGIKALPVFHYSPDDMKHLSHTGNKCQLFAFAPV